MGVREVGQRVESRRKGGGVRQDNGDRAVGGCDSGRHHRLARGVVEGPEHGSACLQGGLHQRFRLLLKQVRHHDGNVRQLCSERSWLFVPWRLLLAASLRRHDLNLRLLCCEQRFRLHERRRLLLRSLFQRDLCLFRERSVLHGWQQLLLRRLLQQRLL